MYTDHSTYYWAVRIYLGSLYTQVTQHNCRAAHMNRSLNILQGSSYEQVTQHTEWQSVYTGHSTFYRAVRIHKSLNILPTHSWLDCSRNLVFFPEQWYHFLYSYLVFDISHIPPILVAGWNYPLALLRTLSASHLPVMLATQHWPSTPRSSDQVQTS